MLTALLALSGSLFSFLGGTVFRLVFGEVMAFLNKRIDHQHELAMMDKQLAADERRAQLQQAAAAQQAELGIKVIEAQREAAAELLDAETFMMGVKATTIQTGIRLIDAWNASIRPGVATWAIVMLTIEAMGWLAFFGGAPELSDGTREVISAALGLFLADRSLARRGK